MASINDIQIKSLKPFRDHEGCMIAQGNIYYKGKKLGFWSQDSWGGSDIFEFDEGVLDHEVEEFKKNFDGIEEKYRHVITLDSLLYELVNLTEIEKDFKKGVKKGFKSYVYATDGIHVRGFYHVSDDVDVIRSDPYFPEFESLCKKEFLKNPPCSTDPVFYTSLNDFKKEYRG